MALITSPSALARNTDVVIDTATFEIEILTTGAVSSDGVSTAALYSFLMITWNTAADLPLLPFPMRAIDNDAGKFAIGQNDSGFNPWTFKDDTTRKLLRGGGLTEYDETGALLAEWIGVFSGVGVEPASQPYYAFTNDAAATDFAFPGPVDELVQIFGDAAHGNFDKRSERLRIFVRTPNNTFDNAVSAALPQLATTLKPIFAPMGLSEALDTNIAVDDATIDGAAPYTGMSITYHASPVSRDIGGANSDFSVVIDGNNGTAEQIYAFAQRQLRRDANINAGAGTVNGRIADALLLFVGDTLETLQDSDGRGVYIDNFNSNDINRIVFRDDAGGERRFPFFAGFGLSFNSVLQGIANATYFIYFASTPDGDYGTTDAVLVENSAGTPLTGLVGGASSISETFDYDSNAQGGRAPGTNADIVIVVIAPGAGYLQLTGTITRSTGISFQANAVADPNIIL